MESTNTDLNQIPDNSASKNVTQNDTYYPEEEVTEGNWKTPKVNVVDVKIVTGEEDEIIFWSQRSKLYRWKDKAWKQRGVGEAKLLENKKTGKIRFLLRQEKTFKIVANHYVLPTEVYCKLSPNAGSDKIWVWAVLDYAEETVENEQFAIKFGSVEHANIFKEKFEEACKRNLKIMNPQEDKKNPETIYTSQQDVKNSDKNESNEDNNLPKTNKDNYDISSKDKNEASQNEHTEDPSLKINEKDKSQEKNE